MNIALWAIGTELVAGGLVILIGLWQTRTRHPETSAPWGYQGKRRMPATPDRDWMIA